MTAHPITTAARPPSTYAPAGSGKRYRWGPAEISVLISPLRSTFTHTAAWLVEIPADRSVDFLAQQAVDRLYYCMSGCGTAHLGDVPSPVAAGSFIHCGRGVHLRLDAGAHEPLALAACSLPVAAEAREDLVNAGQDLASHISTRDARMLLGILDREEVAAHASASVGPGYVVAPDEGDSFWQAAPTPGYVTCKLKSDVVPVHYFSAAIQLLEPGAHVREHGHERACEMLIAVQGESAIRIDGGDELDFSAGSAVLAGPKSLHTFRNTGAGDFVVFAIATPSEIEAGLRATGVRRLRGEPRPSHIPRNPQTGRLLSDKYGFIIPHTQSDAQPATDDAGPLTA